MQTNRSSRGAWHSGILTHQQTPSFDPGKNTRSDASACELIHVKVSRPQCLNISSSTLRRQEGPTEVTHGSNTHHC